MLNRRTLQRINERPRSIERRPLVILGAGALLLSLVLALPLSMPLPALGVLAVGALGVLGVYRSQSAKMVTTLTYDLDPEARARFDGIQESLASLASADKIWRVTRDTGQKDRNQKSGSSDSSRDGRQPVRVGRLKPPGIRTNIPIWGMESSEQQIFFFPEAVLTLKERYTPIPYDSLEVSFSTERRPEEGEVPTGAEVVGHTWRHVGRNDKPDRRYTNNPEIPVILYGLLEISGPSGFEMLLLVSDRDVAASFARIFGSDTETQDTSEEPPEEGDREKKTHRSAAEIEQERRTAEALEMLGLEGGASEGEINTAYREMARLYHPDKVANESVEVREYAEGRMKEINAAYAQLKRMGRSNASGV